MLFLLSICALQTLVFLPTNAHLDEYHPKVVPPLFSLRVADSLRTYVHTLGPMKGYDRFVFDEETASVHLSRYDPATKLLHSGSLQAGLERSEVANRRTVKVNASRATADCIRLSFRLYCCESDFLSKEVECFLENRGPYYGQTQSYFKNRTAHSKAENAELLRKTSLNTYIHEVVEVMKSRAGYSVLRIRPGSFDSDVVSIQPATDEAFLDAYLEDGPSLLTLLVRNGGLWIRRYRMWRGADTSTEDVPLLGEHDVRADYVVCATEAYFAILSRTVEPHDLGYVAMNLQIKVHRRHFGQTFEVCESILATDEHLQLGCGSDTVDIFSVKNDQIRHLVVLLPSTFGRPSVGVPSLCHCGICSCGISMHKYSYPAHPYNDTGVNSYDAPDACKAYGSYEPADLDNDDASSDAVKKWTVKPASKLDWARLTDEPSQ